MRRRRKRVGYLYSPTFGVTTTTSSSTLTGAGNSGVYYQGLLLNMADAPPDVASVYGFERLGAGALPDVIVDSIHGQLHWGISQPSAGAAPTGVAAVTVRAMIYSAPQAPLQGIAGMPAMQVSGHGAMANTLADISDSTSLWTNQARPTTGTRLWWSKTWFSVRNWSSTIDGTTWDSSMCDPPSTWVSMKPRKRMKSTDALYVGIQYSLVNLNSFTGTTQITMAPSFRIAGHPVRARKF